MAQTYIVYNGANATTAAPASVTTGTAVKTLLQLVPATNNPLRVIEWGISFDGSAAATPGHVELVHTGTVAATVTAFVAGDVNPFSNSNDPTQTAGTSGVPLNLGTALSGYTASAEGTITVTRHGDLQLLSPTVNYVKQFPLGREFYVPPAGVLRVRVTFAAAINASTYVIFEV